MKKFFCGVTVVLGSVTLVAMSMILLVLAAGCEQPAARSTLPPIPSKASDPPGRVWIYVQTIEGTFVPMYIDPKPDAPR